jgi:anti-sigma28 factor (negative regulator of flagellin synthesis)
MLATEDLAALARKLREQTDLTPERAAYLNRLAADIREGKYSVDAEGLADKLIDDLLPDPSDDPGC